jgi:hypothetical protein
VTVPQALFAGFAEVLLWGLLATAGMTTILAACQELGLSRLSLPFLLGTLFTPRRSAAQVLGYLVVTLGGWVFAFVYLGLFVSMGRGNWWIGALLGAAHGVVFLVTLLPLIAYVHPRMAGDYDGPVRSHRLEPPGFMGQNYGYRTPLTVLVAQCAYGAVLGLGAQLGMRLH